MVGKIRAAVAARTDPDFVIVARTDAPFDEAVERAHAYLEAGADMIKPIPKSRRELELWPQKVAAPLHVGYMSNIGGRTINDGMTCWDIGGLGYTIVTFPLSMLFMCAQSMLHYLHEIKEKGTDEGLTSERLSFAEYQRFIGLDAFIALEKKYSAG
jgi:2-methylisocitrate lyase-like PEP mutase family enzyme